MGMLTSNHLVLACAAIIMVYAAASDAARYRIPNVACLGLLLLFPLYALTTPTSLPIFNHVVTFLVTLGIGYAMYLKRWAGAGDIKLLAVISLWAGDAYIGTFLFVTALAGGVLSLGIGVTTLVKNRLAAQGDQKEIRKTPIPYGLAIAVGGLCLLALLSNPAFLQQG